MPDQEKITAFVRDYVRRRRVELSVREALKAATGRDGAATVPHG